MRYKQFELNFQLNSQVKFGFQNNELSFENYFGFNAIITTKYWMNRMNFIEE